MTCKRLPPPPTHSDYCLHFESSPSDSSPVTELTRGRRRRRRRRRKRMKGKRGRRGGHSICREQNPFDIDASFNLIPAH